MERPTWGMVERLLALTGEAYAFEDLDEFRVGILDALLRAVPADWASYNEVGEHPGEGFGISIPELPPDAYGRWLALAHEHPTLEHMRRTLDGRPRRISDHLDRAAFHSLALYRDFYREIGVEFQVAFTLPARAPAVLGIALSRGPQDFSDEECVLLAHARPHLIQAYRNAQLASTRTATLAALSDGLDAGGQLVVVADRAGRIEFATTAARRVLAAHLQADPASGRLPDQLRLWIDGHRRRGASATEPLILGAGADALLVRLLAGREPGALDLLLLEAGDGGMSVSAIRSLGLTAREAEALRWVALGRSAPEAARLMAISPRTAAKHLQNVYAKLGVSSRSQAAATAWAAIGVAAPV